MTDAEPEAGPASDLAGREEGVEDPRQQLLGNSTAVIVNDHVGLEIDRAEGEPHPPAGATSLDRISEQVHEHLLELDRGSGDT